MVHDSRAAAVAVESPPACLKKWKNSEMAASKIAESVALGVWRALESSPKMSRGEMVLLMAAAGAPSIKPRMHGQLR